MGIPIDLYRQRIGSFTSHGHGGTKSSVSSGGDCNNCGLALKIFPVGVIVLLLIIAGVETNPGPDHLCKYCDKSFASLSHFCDHAKLHQSTKNFSILCGFPKCLVRLASVESYKSHVSRTHVSKVVPKRVLVPSNLSCPVATCTTRIISRESYSKHMVHDHLKKGHSFQCIYEGCETVFSYAHQFRTHLSRYHPVSDEAPSFCDSEMSDDVDETGNDNNENDDDDSMLCDDDNPSAWFAADDDDVDLYPDSLIKEELARFYLKLEAVFIVPSSTVQEIAKEIKVITELTHYRLRRGLFKELKKTNLDKDLMVSVVQKTFREDTVFNVHHKHEDHEQLGTHHSRLVYWQKTFPLTHVREIPLGVSDTGKSRKAHYVSIRKSLEILLKDPKVKAAVLKSFDFNPSEDSEVLSDYMDGTAYQAHRKRHEGPCLQLFLFQDAFDFNAFGPSSGVYKPVGFYFSLGNIPAIYRSKVDLIQLVYMILENDLKLTQAEEIKDFDKTKKALKPLLDELKELKQNGIEIDGKKIPVCLLFLLGDSLGQNTIGGYVKNFSSAEFWCRFCPMSKTEFRSTPYQTKPLRTEEDYDKYCATAKLKWLQLRRQGLRDQKRAREQAKRRVQKIAKRSSAPSKRNLKGPMCKSAFDRMCRVSYRGVKYRPSAFNSKDIDFHVVGAQPPCLAHDLFEGIVKTVVASVLKHLIEKKGWFDLPCLNRRIKGFKCKGSDALDAPAPLKTLDKLTGNACQNWNFLRLLPFMVSDLIQDPYDPMWQLFLQLKQICEFVCAPRITRRQVSYLQFIVESYLSKVKDLLPKLLVAKAHFLSHYGDLTLMFGPLIRLFTLRFESKHSFFKNVVRACKNYRNITYTMANKYNFRFAYDHGSNDLLPLDIVYNSNFTVGVNPDLLSDTEKKLFPPDFDWDDVEELRAVFINGINYTKEFYFILGSEGTGLKVGRIERIFLIRSSSEVLFLYQERFAENSHNGYYIVQKNNICSKLSSLSQLPDYYALPAYNVDGYDCLSLKHSNINME